MFKIPNLKSQEFSDNRDWKNQFNSIIRISASEMQVLLIF